MTPANGWIFLIVGLFTVICTAADFEFFMNNRKARFFISIVGRDGARIFYSLLGVVFIGAGVVALLGLAP